MPRLLATVSWLLCVVYSTIPSFWLLVHPFAARWRARPTSPYRILLPAWIAMWVLVALVTSPWRHFALYRSPWMWLPAGALIAAGLGLYRGASRRFSAGQLGGVPELAPRGRAGLVTSGIRRRVRHPIYLGHLCEMLGWSLGSALAVNFGLTLFALLTGALMVRAEDRELERRFGAEFTAYRDRVPGIVPRWRP